MLAVFCPRASYENLVKTPVFLRLSVSPGAPQSAQTSFPGTCWISRRDRAALSLSDISVRIFASLAASEMFGRLQRAAARVKACSTWLCSAGKSAQVPALSPGGGGTQTRAPSLTVHVMVGADLAAAPGPDSSHRRPERRRTPLKEVKSWGLSQLSFPHYSPLLLCTRALQPRTLTAMHSVLHSCNICRGFLGRTRLKRGIMGASASQRRLCSSPTNELF